MTLLPTTAPAALAPASTAPAVPPFRRTAVAPRRRRPRRLLRALRRLALPLALAAAPAALGAWMLTSPRFALTTVEVAGGGRVSREWVDENLAPLAGENLLRLPLSEVDRRVRSNPWVAGVEIEKELPGRLRVKVLERQPAVVAVVGAGLWYADAQGALIAPVGDQPAPALPRVRDLRPAAGDSPARAGAPPARLAGVPGALAVLGDLAAYRPDWAAGLVEIGVLGDEDFVVTTAALPWPLLLRPGSVGAKGPRLAALLPEILGRYDDLAAVDLRFSRRIVLRKSHVEVGAALNPKDDAT
jgi:POTRA domain, FtsQ-type